MTPKISTVDIFRCPVIPVLTVEGPASGVALAQALAEGGLDVIEVTLRTPTALDVVRAIAAELPDVLVGVGTVNRAGQFDEAKAAGAQFAVSPGATEALIDAAKTAGMPWLPGAATVSESMRLLDEGIVFQKLFPAASAGGIPYLKAVFSPVPDVVFCPTGGLNESNAADFLALANVGCVGGSWVAPSDAVAAGDWARITTLAASASSLVRQWSPPTRNGG